MYYDKIVVRDSVIKDMIITLIPAPTAGKAGCSVFLRICTWEILQSHPTVSTRSGEFSGLTGLWA